MLKKTHIIKQSNYDAKFLPNYMPKNRQTKQRRPIFCVCTSRSWSGRSIWQVGPGRSLLSVTVRTAGSILFVTIAYYSSYLVHNQSAWQVQRCPYYLSLIRLGNSILFLLQIILFRLKYNSWYPIFEAIFKTWKTTGLEKLLQVASAVQVLINM